MFACQFCITTYLLINEFVFGSLVGIFLLLAFAHYVNFLTFTLVVDSCQTKKMDEKVTCARVVNTAFRIFMRMAQLAFIAFAIWGPQTCTDKLYPWTFMCLIATIVVHNLYDFFLFKENYFVDLDKMPPPSENRLRFNKDLFLLQTKLLFAINIVFGVVSILVIVFSFAFIQNGNGIYVLCYQETSWAALDFIGTCFIAAHQMLIMMQVSMS